MLYDKRWDKTETKADPFSLESLIAWLEKQNPKQLYDFAYAESCLVAQYLRANGVEKYELYSWEVKALGWYEIAFNRDSTFGGALKRARAAL